MSSIVENNRRIAKNTFILYLRTIMILGTSLYTSRIILSIIGIENFGIYNIVGGFVAVFSIISATMVASTQRYLTYELGKKDNHSQEFFGVAMNIHIGIGIILLLLFETIGLWFLNSRLNIAQDRIVAANWLYQCSIFTFLINVISAPYLAIIISHEKMKAFAYINVIEVSLKLLIVYLLLLFSMDRLILYGIFLLFVSIFVRFIYALYCNAHFKESEYIWVKDTRYYKEMIRFAGLNFFGACSAILSSQGVNILLNLFFGVTVNAARGIALQVEAAITKFVNDFTTALNPQITKSYAAGDIEYMMELTYRGSKFSFFLFFFFSLPILIQTPLILSIWLKEVPEYTVIFIRYSLVIAMLNTLSYSLTTCAFATGNIKSLSIWLGCIRFSVLPLCYIVLNLGFSAYVVYVVSLIIDFILLFVRLKIVSHIIDVSMSVFFSNVILKVMPVVVLSVIVSCGLYLLISVDSFFTLIFFTMTTCFATGVLIYFWGFDKNEQLYVNKMIISKLNRN